MKHPLHILLLLLVLMLSACATSQNHHDPIEPVNRVSDAINDGIDRISLKPLAQGYTAGVPKPMRTAVSNFYDNATYMNTVLNDFLQGKGQQGFSDLMRFLINTVLGLGGLVDVATSMGFERHEEDFGQTLATWGFSQGAYLVYPLLGSTSLRDTPDFLTATATDPLFWAGLVVAPYVTIPITALKYVDKRAQLLEASNMRDELALDPYVFTREAWKQHRDYLIHDGHPPVSKMDDDDDWEDDDFDSDEDMEIAEGTIPLNPADTKNFSNKADAMDSPMTTRISLANPSATDLATPETNSPDNVDQLEGAIYIIFLSWHYSEVEAAAEQGRIAKLGITSKIDSVSINQHIWSRLQASRYNNKEEALLQLEILKLRTGLGNAWLEAVSNDEGSKNLH